MNTSAVPTLAATEYPVSSVLRIAGDLSRGFGTVSIVASILTIKLIHDIGRWNGYMKIIYAMTWCLIMYDLTFYGSVEGLHVKDSFLMKVNYFFSTTFGIAVSLWTNVITCIVLHVVLRLQSFDVLKHYWKFQAYIMLFSAGFGAFYTVFEKQLLIPYNSLLLASIIVNAAGYARVAYKLNAMGASKSDCMDPVNILVSRLKYYPILQFLTRLPTAVYELRYGGAFEDLYEIRSLDQAILLYASAATLPLTGLGFFISFLYMQPLAQERLCEIMSVFCCSTCCSDSDDRIADGTTNRGVEGGLENVGIEGQPSIKNPGLSKSHKTTKKHVTFMMPYSRGASRDSACYIPEVKDARSSHSVYMRYADEDELDKSIDERASRKVPPVAVEHVDDGSTTNAMWIANPNPRIPEGTI
jgi:hypothetical protein